MAEEKKPGLLKRMFSFGFGKKNQEQEEADTSAIENAERIAKEAAEAETKAREEAQRIAKEEQEAEAEKRAEEKRQAEEEAKRLAQEAKQAAEKERKAAEKAEEEAKAEVEKRAKAEEKAAKLEAKRLEKESEAAAKAEAKRLKTEQEAEAKHLAAEEKKCLEAQEAERIAKEKQEAERIVQEQEETERLAFEKAEESRKAEEAIAAREAAEQVAARKTEEQNATSPSPETTEDEARRQGWFKRLRKGLSQTSNNLKDNISSVFTKTKLDDDTLQDLEDILIQADIGVETALKITDALADQRFGKDITDREVREVMAGEIEKVLEPVAHDLALDLDHQPHVILVVGVNGSGKTTTIGKISQKLYDAGFSTLLVAGDTFRAAAIEQLHIWGDRTMAPVMSRENGADSAGLAFDAWADAKEQRRDVMLMDTAGRLQNKKELMDELEKIIRVLKKQDPTAPHTVLLTLDATTGQNALNQVEIFKDVAGVNGLVMTKLDGTARGGILVAIAAKHKLPVYFIGVGEQVEDLEPFEADVFARAIAGLDDDAH
ncbi:MAG: signal recognition particle-docking protein FtsY [Pseudomonadota bacterium]